MTEADQKAWTVTPVLFLDFDGTLAPIMAQPDQVRLEVEELELLESLARTIPVFVISGRAFPDIERRVPVRSLSGLSGDHGAVRRFRDRLHIHPEAERSRNALSDWSPILLGLTEKVPGAVMEVKEFSLSIHYRGVDPAHVPTLSQEVEKLFGSWADRDRFRISQGKMVWEIRPLQGVTKEETVDFFLELLTREFGRSREEFFPVMIGDDTTDLAAVNHVEMIGGRGIWVGPPPSGLDPRAARFSSTKEVWDFLVRLKTVLTTKESPVDAIEHMVTGQ